MKNCADLSGHPLMEKSHPDKSIITNGGTIYIEMRQPSLGSTLDMGHMSDMLSKSLTGGRDGKTIAYRI